MGTSDAPDDAAPLQPDSRTNNQCAFTGWQILSATRIKMSQLLKLGQTCDLEMRSFAQHHAIDYDVYRPSDICGGPNASLKMKVSQILTR